jgi:hypothetical protein
MLNAERFCQFAEWRGQYLGTSLSVCVYIQEPESHHESRLVREEWSSTGCAGHRRIAKPQPEPGEVLVRVHVSGINPSNVKGRRGRPLPGPKVAPHSDGAGIIDEVGEGLPGNRIGERVWLLGWP